MEPPYKLRLPIDREAAFDYDEGVSHKYKKQDLIKMIYEEIHNY